MSPIYQAMQLLLLPLFQFIDFFSAYWQNLILMEVVSIGNVSYLLLKKDEFKFVPW